MQGMIRRAVAKFVMGLLSKAWNAWWEAVEEKRGQRRKLTKAVTALTSRKLRAALNSWADQVVFLAVANKHLRLSPPHELLLVGDEVDDTETCRG